MRVFQQRERRAATVIQAAVRGMAARCCALPSLLYCTVW